MGRVFDFNMRADCVVCARPGSCAAPERARRPAAADAASGVAATPRRFPISDILHCLNVCIYMLLR
jgi:hypothetical protein